jgi:hypothetical protein
MTSPAHSNRQFPTFPIHFFRGKAYRPRHAHQPPSITTKIWQVMQSLTSPVRVLHHCWTSDEFYTVPEFDAEQYKWVEDVHDLAESDGVRALADVVSHTQETVVEKEQTWTEGWLKDQENPFKFGYPPPKGHSMQECLVYATQDEGHETAPQPSEPSSSTSALGKQTKETVAFVGYPPPKGHKTEECLVVSNQVEQNACDEVALAHEINKDFNSQTQPRHVSDQHNTRRNSQRTPFRVVLVYLLKKRREKKLKAMKKQRAHLHPQLPGGVPSLNQGTVSESTSLDNGRATSELSNKLSACSKSFHEIADLPISALLQPSSVHQSKRDVTFYSRTKMQHVHLPAVTKLKGLFSKRHVRKRTQCKDCNSSSHTCRASECQRGISTNDPFDLDYAPPQGFSMECTPPKTSLVYRNPLTQPSLHETLCVESTPSHAILPNVTETEDAVVDHVMSQLLSSSSLARCRGPSLSSLTANVPSRRHTDSESSSYSVSCASSNHTHRVTFHPHLSHQERVNYSFGSFTFDELYEHLKDPLESLYEEHNIGKYKKERLNSAGVGVGDQGPSKMKERSRATSM